MVSISTGEIRLDGVRAHYEVRMPLFEVAQLKDPEKAMMTGIRFLAGGIEARRVDGRCRKVDSENALICNSVYEFPVAVETLEAVSEFHKVTVPNHVHLLRAVRGDFNDQAVLDLSFPKAQLRFRPPTPMERIIQQTVSGAVRAAGGLAQLLFLAALVLAARSRRELSLLAGTFITGEIVSCVLLPLVSWQPAPRFVEAAAALTIAYLAVEIVLLPEAGQRWLVVAILGLFHGLYFAMFIQSTDFAAGWVLGGGAFAEIALIAVLAWLMSKTASALGRFPAVRVTAGMLLFVGLAWFFTRLSGT
jgi:hypothetical protein